MAFEWLTYYEVLAVQPDADQATIEAAYRRQARLHHPDLNPSPGSTARMARLNDAYRVLRNPLLRAQYDRSLAQTHQNESRPSRAAFNRNGGRARPGRSRGRSPAPGSVEASGMRSLAILTSGVVALLLVGLGLLAAELLSAAPSGTWLTSWAVPLFLALVLASVALAAAATLRVSRDS